jgi:putative oxidoreductase
MDGQSNMREVGFPVLRVGLAIIFILHGYPKITGGSQTWIPLGGAMETFGIGFAPAFWGCLAAVAEFGGGICLVLGLFFRISCALLGITMFVAASMLRSRGAVFSKASHPLAWLIVLVSLLLVDRPCQPALHGQRPLQHRGEADPPFPEVVSACGVRRHARARPLGSGPADGMRPSPTRSRPG